MRFDDYLVPFTEWLLIVWGLASLALAFYGIHTAFNKSYVEISLYFIGGLALLLLPPYVYERWFS